ncbi:hypothetical protein HR060_11565 [Catenovulum sp. SM1970]|uniref:hypothetical protein n=1 Tax=Marinifaba aquimaris TaxID=2741323 RepID=UPI00157277BB|nr:hypothetical protein [Marinifaba aquimaris]NTS77500.1 hypothetical protein [Marinifaba aquimaris]
MFKLSNIALLVSLSALSMSAAALTAEQESKLRDVLGCLSQSDATVRVDGCNLQIINGGGFTRHKNGLGNMIVGYNNQASAPSVPDFSNDGSHNFVLGHSHIYTSTGNFIAGTRHEVYGTSGFVTGHFGTTTQHNNTIAGGKNNHSHGIFSAVLGGQNNGVQNGSQSSVVIGGELNRVNSFWTSVSGGFANFVDGQRGSVSGGRFNRIPFEGNQGTIVGGEQNTVSNEAASILGGKGNNAGGFTSTIGGGLNRSTDKNYEFRAGNMKADN